MISCERCSINFVKDSYDIVLIVLQYIVLILCSSDVKKISIKIIISISLLLIACIVLAPTGALSAIMRHRASGNPLLNVHCSPRPV